MNVNKVNVLKENIILKNAKVEYDIFDSDILEVSKIVDRPDDYYFPGDIIIFTIKIKNNGTKILRNIKMTDVLDDIIEPINVNYEVISNYGEYVITDNIINVINITLEPKEEAIITIKAKIKDSKENNVINS